MLLDCYIPFLDCYMPLLDCYLNKVCFG